MDISKKIDRMYKLFLELEQVSSRNLKEELIKEARSESPELSKDIDYALEVLDGQHKLGYTFVVPYCKVPPKPFEGTLEDFLKPLYQLETLSNVAIYGICRKYVAYSYFLQPLLNREWRLGIGKSQLEKKAVSPMLAKKFDASKKPKDASSFYVTEKLDGNRCVAQFNEETKQWEFFSRTGKKMKVAFDMSSFCTSYVYDGEILSREQLENPSQENFNALSGLVNSKKEEKEGLVYVIFDVITNLPYAYRRERILNCMKETVNVKVLPVLGYYPLWEELCTNLPELLTSVTNRGGEGVMINVGTREYEQKRTDALLKLKEVQTMDMEVVEFLEGTGKHQGTVGSLECMCVNDDKLYTCRVGSGLSDYQREIWMNDPSKIIGKIVEVAYFSISQNSRVRGEAVYSLRFPRLKRVRDDKQETSIY